MEYDPIKRSLGKVFNSTPVLRKLFYNLLDLLLLRTWHVKKEIREWSHGHDGPARILDAGMGFGQYSYFLSGFNENWNVKGVDVKEEQIADCNAFFQKIGRANASFSFADLTAFDEPSTYDFILSVDVMEHILDDTAVFRNFHKSLRPGGMVLISTPSDQGGSDVHEHDEGSFIEEHVRDGYNMQEIQEKLRASGFSRTEAGYQYGKPGQVSWRLSMKYPIQMLGVSKLFFILLPFYYIITFPVSLLLNYADVKGKHETGTGLIVKAWK
jgi:SAM-dependent methyltransferase